jgi:hypothetical protein
MALSGLAGATALGDIALQLAPLHPRHDTFLAEVLLDLAAEAVEESGATRDEPIESAGTRKRHLTKGVAHTKAQHHKSEDALRAAAMARAEIDPGLLDEVVWRQTDDLWAHITPRRPSATSYPDRRAGWCPHRALRRSSG